MSYRLRIFKGSLPDFINLVPQNPNTGIHEATQKSFQHYIQQHKNAMVVEGYNTPQEVLSHYKLTFQEIYDSNRVLLLSNLNDSELLCLTTLN